MTFLWPHLLWLLLAVPLVIAAYIYVLRRKRKAAVRYASLTMVREAMNAGQSFRRHIPPILRGCAPLLTGEIGSALGFAGLVPACGPLATNDDVASCVVAQTS